LFFFFVVTPTTNKTITITKINTATMLMKRSQREMADVFDAEYVSLHVRKSNRAAFHLYSVTLVYEVNDVEKGYYADGEDAYDMRCYFKKDTTQNNQENNNVVEKKRNEVDDEKVVEEKKNNEDDVEGSSSSVPESEQEEESSSSQEPLPLTDAMNKLKV
jgi:hypothetical protein